MFGRSSDACESCIRQCLLGGEARRGFGIEEGTGKGLGCGVGYQGPASQMSAFPQAASISDVPSSASLFPYLS